MGKGKKKLKKKAKVIASFVLFFSSSSLFKHPTKAKRGKERERERGEKKQSNHHKQMRHKLNINIWLSFQLRSYHKKHTNTKSCRDHKGRRKTTTTTSRKWPTYEFMMRFCCLVLWLVGWISTPHLKAKPKSKEEKRKGLCNHKEHQIYFQEDAWRV